MKALERAAELALTDLAMPNTYSVLLLKAGQKENALAIDKTLEDARKALEEVR